MNKKWWEPHINEDGSRDWLCDNDGDWMETCDGLWAEIERLGSLEKDYCSAVNDRAVYRSALEHIQYQCRHLPTSREEQQIGMILTTALNNALHRENTEIKS